MALHIDELRVLAIRNREKLGVGPLFRDPAILDYEQARSFSQSGQPVRDSENRALLDQALERLLDLILGLRVDAARHFVQYQD